VTLLCDLDAFYTEHRRCGELDGGLDGPTVWIACEPRRTRAAQVLRLADSWVGCKGLRSCS